MIMKEYEHLIGVIDGEDFCNLLECILSEEGFTVVAERLCDIERDNEKYLQILRQKPEVLVFNVDYPLERNLAVINSLLAHPESRGLGVVYTSASKKAVDDLLGSNETIGLPFESCDQLPRAIRQIIVKQSFPS